MTESEILTLLQERVAATDMSLLPKIKRNLLDNGDTFFDRKGRFVIYDVVTNIVAEDFLDICFAEAPGSIRFLFRDHRHLELKCIPESDRQTDIDGFLRDLIPFSGFLEKYPDAVVSEDGCHCFDMQDGVLFGYFGNGVDVPVPSGVREIDLGAFVDNRWLRSVILPEGVEKVADYAFADCVRLHSVRLPETLVSLGRGAFSRCLRLKTINIPHAIREIAPYCFDKNYSLRSIVIPEGITRIGNAAFSACSRLRQMELPDSVAEIGDLAFADCFFLRYINLPEGLMQIGQEAFLNCRKLHEIRIPEGTAIGGGAFNGCHFDRVDFGKRTDFTSILDNDLRLIAERCVICGGELEEVSDKPGMRCSSCGCYFSHRDMQDWPSFVIRDTILTDYIGYGRVIPDGVTKIAFRAFDDAVVPALEIPSSVTEIEAEAFLWCDFALSPSLPSGLKKLEQKVFCGSNIRSLYLPDTLRSMEDECLLGCEQLGELKIPGSVTCIGVRAVSECVSLERLVLHEGLGVIREEAFLGCRRLEEVQIPRSVYRIGKGAFKGCTGLKKVFLPEELAQFDWKDTFEPATELVYYP